MDRWIQPSRCCKRDSGAKLRLLGREWNHLTCLIDDLGQGSSAALLITVFKSGVDSPLGEAFAWIMAKLAPRSSDLSPTARYVFSYTTRRR
jgi:hypothetical protein